MGSQRNLAPIRLGRQYSCERFLNRVAMEWTLAAQQLPNDHAERPDISPFVDVLTACLLRAHIRSTAEHHSAFGETQAECIGLGIDNRRLFDSLGETEIQNLHSAVRADLDVGGLQIAMDKALFVGFP